MNAIAVKHDILVFTDDPCKTVIVKICKWNVNGTGNMAPFKPDFIAHIDKQSHPDRASFSRSQHRPPHILVSPVMNRLWRKQKQEVLLQTKIKWILHFSWPLQFVRPHNYVNANTIELIFWFFLGR